MHHGLGDVFAADEFEFAIPPAGSVGGEWSSDPNGNSCAAFPVFILFRCSSIVVDAIDSEDDDCASAPRAAPAMLLEFPRIALFASQLGCCIGEPNIPEFGVACPASCAVPYCRCECGLWKGGKTGGGM